VDAVTDADLPPATIAPPPRMTTVRKIKITVEQNVERTENEDYFSNV
jgi:hypothetical protein